MAKAKTTEVEDTMDFDGLRYVRVTVEGITPLIMGAALISTRAGQETADAHDKRCWLERCHTNESGEAFIPAIAWARALAATSRKTGRKIPGRGNSTYASHFECGVSVARDTPIGHKAADAVCERIYTNADGRRGSGKRVWRHFPRFSTWGTTVELMIADNSISQEEFERTFNEAGALNGIGSFRKEKGNMNGQFRVTKFHWA